jgi:hypothetical protein
MCVSTRGGISEQVLHGEERIFPKLSS